MTTETKMLIGLGIVTIALLGGAVFFLSGDATKPPEESTPVNNEQLVRVDSPTIATESASVTIVEFGDYQCPACAAAHPVVEKVLTDFQNDVKFVFRHFPLPMHQNAVMAAEAVEAAGEQGKYWEMHELVYERQEEWSEESSPLPVFKSYARELDLDENKFEQAILEHKYLAKINRDKEDGNALGVNSTPTFYIDGVKVTTQISYEFFAQKINEAKSN